MHGIYLAELQMFVEAKLGHAAWDAVVAKAGLPGAVYQYHEMYPDEDMMALVGAAVELSGIERDPLLRDFGKFVAPALMRAYRELIPSSWRTLDIIENLEGSIHRVIREQHPEARPPEIKANRDSPSSVVIQYSSDRQLCAGAQGIVEGLAEHYGEKLVIIEPRCMRRGAPYCEFRIVHVATGVDDISATSSPEGSGAGAGKSGARDTAIGKAVAQPTQSWQNPPPGPVAAGDASGQRRASRPTYDEHPTAPAAAAGSGRFRRPSSAPSGARPTVPPPSSRRLPTADASGRHRAPTGSGRYPSGPRATGNASGRMPALPSPGASGMRPAVPPPSSRRLPTADASGRHRAPSPSSSGRLPVADASGRHRAPLPPTSTSDASGRYRAPRPSTSDASGRYRAPRPSTSDASGRYPAPTSTSDASGRYPAPGARRADGGTSGRHRAGISGMQPAATGRTPPGRGESLGQYLLEDELGRGGVGVVFRAIDTHSGGEVALKILTSVTSADGGEALARFRQEARNAAQLVHHHIVGLRDVGEEDGWPYIAMDLIEGTTFELWTPGKPHGLVVRAVRDVATAIAHAHGLGIVHRDLKPQNILVDATARALVTDFGLSRDLNEDMQLTQAGQCLGTPEYMAPEQFEGVPGLVGPPADVYALGCLLYVGFTGRAPFTGSTLPTVVRRVLTKRAKTLRERGASVDPALDKIVQHCLVKEPADRFPSAGALAQALLPFVR